MSTLLNLYRLAAYALFVFFVGHTFQGLLFPPSFGRTADMVLRQMKDDSFVFFGSTSTWYGFYFGFGLIVSIFLLFSIVFTWYIGGQALNVRRNVRPIAWALSLSYATAGVVAIFYIFLGATILNFLVAILLAAACIRDTVLDAGRGTSVS